MYIDLSYCSGENGERAESKKRRQDKSQTTKGRVKRLVSRPK